MSENSLQKKKAKGKYTTASKWRHRSKQVGRQHNPRWKVLGAQQHTVILPTRKNCEASPLTVSNFLLLPAGHSCCSLSLIWTICVSEALLEKQWKTWKWKKNLFQDSPFNKILKAISIIINRILAKKNLVNFPLPFKQISLPLYDCGYLYIDHDIRKKSLIH